MVNIIYLIKGNLRKKFKLEIYVIYEFTLIEKPNLQQRNMKSLRNLNIRKMQSYILITNVKFYPYN